MKAGNDFEDIKGEGNFTVAIFGSARILKNSPIYEEIRNLAKMIAEAGMNIITGGGPGLMSAASEGHRAGRGEKNAKSIGLRISLPFPEEEASHLDIKKEFDRFSSRLDAFMSYSNVVVVAPGGVGTLLEFAYTWQLLQVRHISDIPIVMLGEMWFDLFNWIDKWLLNNGLIDPEDMNLLFLARDYREAFKVINKAYELYRRENKVHLSKLRHEIQGMGKT